MSEAVRASRDGVPIIQAVVDHDMCIACGACVVACPNQAVEPTFHAGRGAHEVRIVDPGACLGCPAPCDDVCPSIEVDFAELIPEMDTVPREGGARGIWTGFAPEFRDDGVSSSGGVLRSLISAGLEAGTPVICLTEVGDGFSPDRLTETAQLDSVPGSIYHSVSFVGAIELIRESNLPSILVATPCQLEGIRNYIAKIEPTLSDQIELVLGLICGWMYSHHAVSAFGAYKGITPLVSATRYRGEGEVGRLKIRSAERSHSFDRRQFESRSDRIDYLAAFSRYTNRLRCRVCEDHVNVLADVVVGDAWLRRLAGEKSSIVIARTERGVNAIERLRASGRLVLQPAKTADLYESQSEDLVLGESAVRLSSALRSRGIAAPEFRWGETQTPPVQAAWPAVQWEIALRSLVRRGSYRTFRFLYGLRAIWGAARARARRSR